MSSVHNNGSSTIDYDMVHESLLPDIVCFQVYEFQGHISDHCMIIFSINIPHIINPKVQTCKRLTMKTKFIWNNQSSAKLELICNTEMIQRRITKISSGEVGNINTLVHEVQDLMVNIAQKVLRHQKVKKRRKKKWFNHDCRSITNDLKSLGKQLHKEPKNCILRGLFFSKKKQYKKIVQSVKRQYRLKLIKKIARQTKETRKHIGRL